MSTTAVITIVLVALAVGTAATLFVIDLVARRNRRSG
jgi:uncharacterized membrane protein YwzB